MKAILCIRTGSVEELTLGDLPIPIPNPLQVLIKVEACGVNFPDLLIAQGKYQYKPVLPFSPGAEVAGIVVGLGSEVENVVIGDRVFAATGWGGYAEYALAESHKTFPIPADLSFEQAAVSAVTYGTAYHALVDRADLQANETLIVLGAAGGVGLAAVEIGKQLGAKVIAAASTIEKLQLCKEKGADELLLYSEGELRKKIKKMTQKSGIQVVLDPVGGEYTEPFLRAVSRKGRYLTVGYASGTIPQIALNWVLLRELEVKGVFWTSFCQHEKEANRKNFEQISQWLSEGKLQPNIQAAYPLEEAVEAMTKLSNREVMGKIVLRIN
jgi:NADPH:quinone reductase